jgi:hypothetical protein
MRAFVADNRAALALAAGFIAVGLVGGLLVASLLASGRSGEIAAVSPAPSATPGPTAARPSPAPTPVPPATPALTAAPSPAPVVPSASAEPPEPAGTGVDRAADAAIEASIEGLEELDAYRFEVQVGGRIVTDLSSDGGVDFGARGSLRKGATLDVDMLFGFQLVEPGGVASAGSTIPVVVIGNTVWELRGDNPPRSVTLEDAEALLDILPVAVAGRTVGRFAGGYTEEGRERRNGVPTTHYRTTALGENLYEQVTEIDGTCSGDAWVADAGYLVAASVDCRPFDADGNDRGFGMRIDVTDANDATIVIEPPD